VTDPQQMLDQEAAEAGGANVEDDNDRCLYVGTLWENDVIIDHHDVHDFNEASRMIVQTLAVRTCTLVLRSLLCIQNVL
jgi:inorganic pyrophosphatase/exopolyphosphatase